MAEQISGFFLFPDFPLNDAGPNYQALLLDAANEKAAAIISAPKTGTISKIGFKTMNVTTGATMDVRLETLSGNVPSGTLLGANSNGAQVIGSGDDNTYFTTSLTTPVAVTKGDIFAIVIVNPAGSPGDLEIAQVNAASTRGLPYGALYTGSWSFLSEIICMALEYDDGSYAPLPYVLPISAFNIVNFSSASDPDHRGLKFSLPYPTRLIGIWVLADLEGSPSLILYDSDGTTALETLVIASAKRRTAGDDFSFYYFVSNHSLAKDVSYRVVFAPSATAIDLHSFEVDTAAAMDAFPGGQSFHYTQKKGGGGWTDTPTERPFAGLILDGFNDGVGAGGGLLVHPGMAGGFKG